MIEIIPAHHWRETPWKNGKGTTSEIVVEPKGADFNRLDFHWRLSTARITEAGDFSLFPGYERVLMLLQGKEFQIVHEDGETVNIDLWVTHRFSGETKTRCEIPEGPVRDLNFIFDPRRFDPEIEVIKCPKDFVIEMPARKTLLLFPIDGAIKFQGKSAAQWETLIASPLSESHDAITTERHNRILKIVF